jgi:hypothetical protein
VSEKRNKVCFGAKRLACRPDRSSERRTGGVVTFAKIQKPIDSPQDDYFYRLGKRAAFQGKIMRAYVQYYLKYTPETLEKMSLKQLAEAFCNIQYVRGREKEVTLNTL